MNQYYSDRNHGHDTHPVAAGLLGAALGTIVGIAVSSIMSDPEKRRQVGKRMQDLQKWGNETLRDLRDRSFEAEKKMKKNVDDLSEGAERIKGDVKDTSEKIQENEK